MGFSLRHLLGMDAPVQGHPDPQPARQRISYQPIAPMEKRPMAPLKGAQTEQLPPPHQLRTYDLQRPLGLGSYQQEGEFQPTVQGASPMVLSPQVQALPQNRWNHLQGDGTLNVPGYPMQAPAPVQHTPSWVDQTGYHDISKKQHGQSAGDALRQSLRQLF